MSKSATPRPRRAKEQAQIIRQRAARIIANLDDYNADTRDAIYNALEGVPETLAELVTRAAPGDPIWDLTGDAPAIPQPARTGALSAPTCSVNK